MTGLIIFIKNPELGKCKTRLAATIGDRNALDVYLKLLQHTHKVTQKVKANRYLFYHEKIDKNDMWSNTEYTKLLQAKGDLGNRMNEAFSHVLRSNDKAVIIGSDCPEIDQSIIDKAFETLNHTDFVIGPTFDGGYYLLGMKALSPFLFNNMTWSVDSVFKETIKRIDSNQKTYTILEYKSDLDNEDDLNLFPQFRDNQL